MKRIILATFMLVEFTFSSKAYDFMSGDLCYNITSDSTVEVTYKDTRIVVDMKKPTIMGTSKTLEYRDYSELTNVEIPEVVEYEDKTYSVTRVGDEAFSECVNLTLVSIPNSVTSIGDCAFLYCIRLTKVTIPNSITEIGDYAFEDCDSLQYNVYGNACYLGNPNNPYLVLAKAKSEEITSCKISSNCKLICSHAFQRCTELDSIFIPNSTTSISSYAFGNCNNLSSVLFDDKSNLTNINIGMFYGCTNLQFNEYDNALYFGSKANPFLYLFKAKSSDIVSCDINENCKIIFPNAFSHTKLTSATIPNSITIIGDVAFAFCSELTSVTLPNSVTSIGNYSFDNCTSLTSVVIPNSVVRIGSNAFESCMNLTDIEIPQSVTEIEYGAFYDCISIIPLIIPNSVTSIGNNAFYNVNNVVYNGDASYEEWNKYWGAKTINGITDGDFIFEDKEKTRLSAYIGNGGDVVIPNTVKIICDNALCNNSEITSVTIPNTVTEIGNKSFYYCTNLTSIEMPNSINSIGNQAFCGCTGLISVEIPNSVTRINYFSFAGCTSLVTLTIPNSVTTIDVGAFYDCTGLNSVVIPNTVTEIYEVAFYNVKNIEYSGTATHFENYAWGALALNGVPTDIENEIVPTVSIYSYSNVIVVENATSDIYVYDVMGRLVARRNASLSTEIAMQREGIYIVKCGNEAKRIYLGCRN